MASYVSFIIGCTALYTPVVLRPTAAAMNRYSILVVHSQNTLL